MKLLFLLNGRADSILRANNLDPEEVEVIKLDEKKLASFKYVKRLINSKDYDEVFFGAIKSDLQRFHIFMKIYIMFSKRRNGAIIDEFGQQKRFSFSRLFFCEFPYLFLEIVVSSFWVIYSYIKFPILRWRLTKNR